VSGKVVVGYLDTAPGRDALALGGILARATDSELRLLTVEDSDELAAAVREEGADLVVLGSTHRGPLGRMVPGPAIDRLLGEAPCAIAVAPPGFGARAPDDSVWQPLDGDAADAGMRVIGVGYDGSPGARTAIEYATELALRNGAALRVYTVVAKVAAITADAPMTPTPLSETELERRRAELHRVVASLPAEVRALPVLLRGFAVRELIEAVSIGVDLLVLGTHVRGHVHRVLHKGVAGEVLAAASCPVVICPTAVRVPVAA